MVKSLQKRDDTKKLLLYTNEGMIEFDIIGELIWLPLLMYHNPNILQQFYQ